MQNNKGVRFVEALILLPIITLSGGVVNIPANNIDINKASPIVFLQKPNIELRNLFAFNKVIDEEAQVLKLKADAIDNYFKERDMPLYGTGMKMVVEAEKNGLDWRLVAGIAVRESTGGKFECKKADNNAFGWGSCKIDFNSNDHAIEVVAMNLGGNNPNTARYYADKDLKGILRAYNPPHIVRRYAQQVISIMNTISDLDVVLPQIS